MKIAFIGTHGTGKTTLTYEFTALLKKNGYNVDLLKEVVRECPLPINEARTLESQRWISFHQICREIGLSDKNDIVVCDRSILDTYAYSFSKFGHDSLIYSIISEWIKSYDLLFRVPVNKDFLSPVGVRSVDEAFQREVDLAFDTLIEEFKVKVHPFQSVEDVFDKFLEIRR